ncbi:MAG: glutamate--cysteine ligase [Actinobacteria bacterium]|nr:glutamate--cysteine ligase [Actinomycetota bacterium]
MGKDLASRSFTREDRQRYRDKVHRCLDVLAEMLHRELFEFDLPLTGMEVELNLVDGEGQPAMRNAEVLARIDNPAFVQELGRFNLEINIPPQTLMGDGAARYERQVREQLNTAEEKAQAEGDGMVMIGILPTLRPEHLTHEAISANPRYALLDEQMLLARGEDLHIDIRGATEGLETHADSIAPEAACTSVQFHLQVSPENFAASWNAAQCLAGPQLALGANSPWFLGHELWRETRIALFTQATDTRPVEMKAQGVRPRVWFGERWITSVFDLFEENLRYFPALLPVVEDEDPAAELAAGRTPSLAELRLHNGTVWRWNRPVYDVVRGRPHLRIENRVLPSGPTVVDVLANGAFYFGALRALALEDRPVWSRMSFGAAEDNFTHAAQRGIDAATYWPGLGEVPATELVLRRLLPLADEGLKDWGVDDDIRARLLGVIEGRCTTGQNGAKWQVDAVHTLEARGIDRWEALRRMTLEYVERAHSNEPVHTWEPL